jgi:hypothetical protein
VAEAAAQSMPLYALGARPGAAEAATEFATLLDRVYAPARTDGGSDGEL